MKHRKETLTAIVFLLILLCSVGCVVRLSVNGNSNFRKELGKLRRNPDYTAEFIQTAESSLNKDLDHGHHFIQLYGGFQRLSGRRVLNDVEQSSSVVRLDNGYLHFAHPGSVPDDITMQADNTNRLSAELEKLGIPFLYVSAPQKPEPYNQGLPAGLHDFGDDNADRFHQQLLSAGTDLLDLRPVFLDTDDYSSWFFRTDHHWKPEGAFLAWQHLSKVLEQDYGICTDPAYTEDSSYEKRIYSDWFLGSQGKRCGSLYAGTDDITLFIPEFPTDFNYACPLYAIDRSGTFEESLLFPERVEQRDLFNGNPYTLYSGGDYPLATMTNRLNPEGKKVILIRESFSCALAPFLALSTSELTTVDLRYFRGDLIDTIAAIDPDLVITLYSVSSIDTPELFQFFPPGP